MLVCDHHHAHNVVVHAAEHEQLASAAAKEGQGI
jgi:hypothetical protein